MRAFSYRAVAIHMLVSVLLLGALSSSEAQVRPRDVPIVTQPQQRFNSGQDIQPIFEGWTRNDDGSYVFHFGYLNRNYVEQPNIPIGENNFVSPGPEDRGQPTYFYPRTQRYQFTVAVPANFGLEDELVWTVTAHGSTQKATGWLQVEWEVDVNTITFNQRMQFGRGVEELHANQPAEISVEASAPSAAVGESLTLTVMLADDELPTARPPRRKRRRTFSAPAFTPPEDAPDIPDNITAYREPTPARNGLGVLWVVYRGPGDAIFEPSGFQRAVAEDEGNQPIGAGPGGPPASPPPGSESTMVEGDGWTSAKFETVVTFNEPGTYTLRAYGSDSMLLTTAHLTVTVH